jgi:UPF0716 protein FxsA
MMRRVTAVALSLVILAIIEIAVFLLVANTVGFGWALLLLLATSLLGTWLLRREGARAWRRFREVAAAGRPPGGEASRGIVGLLSGLLLAVPGFVTDALGLLLLIPPVRAGGVRLVQRAAERRLSSAAAGDLFGPRWVRSTSRRAPGTAQPQRPSQPGQAPPDEVVEGEIVD